MNKWLRIARETVLSTKWLAVFKDTVVTNKGHEMDDFFVMEKSDIAMVVALTADNKLVLVQEYKHGAEDIVWQLPAGGIRKGTLPLDAASRELQEETGMRSEPLDLLGKWWIAPSYLTNSVYLYIGRNAYIATTPKLEDSEDLEVRMVTLSEAIDMTLRNEIMDPHSTIAILWLAYHSVIKSDGP